MTTVHNIIDVGVKQFNEANLYFGHGIDSAWDEVVFLVLHCLNLPHDTKREILKRELTVAEVKQIKELLERRTTERKPLAYLIHEAWFAGLPFYVDERVLIPRSPMAELIEQQFALWIDPKRVKRILDIGTGSGCIAIAGAHYFPKAKVDATDVSLDALAVAKKNVERHQLQSRVNLLQSDVFSGVKGKYDIIISNPPYVGAKELENVPKEYKHEPRLALAAGQDGLQIVERILKEAAQHLTPYGILVVEVGNSAEALVKKFPQLPFLWVEFERGEGEVFVLTKDDLNKF